MQFVGGLFLTVFFAASSSWACSETLARFSGPFEFVSPGDAVADFKKLLPAIGLEPQEALKSLTLMRNPGEMSDSEASELEAIYEKARSHWSEVRAFLARVSSYQSELEAALEDALAHRKLVDPRFYEVFRLFNPMENALRVELDAEVARLRRERVDVDRLFSVIARLDLFLGRMSSQTHLFPRRSGQRVSSVFDSKQQGSSFREFREFCFLHLFLTRTLSNSSELPSDWTLDIPRSGEPLH